MRLQAVIAYLNQLTRFLLGVALALYAFSGVALATPSLTIRFDTVKVSVASPTAQLRLALTNPLDHIAGLELLLTLSRPDLTIFTGDFDTAGTVIGGWEYLSAAAQQNGSKLHIVGLAEIFPPYNHPPVFPSSSERTLLKVNLQIMPVPDTLTSRNGIVQLDTSLENFGLANYLGQLIGLSQDTVLDTMYYRCIQSDDTGCVLWQQVWSEPYDRIVVDTTIHPYLDPAYFSLPAGQITVLPNCTPIQSPGDVNLDGVASGEDISALQSFVNTGSPALASAHNADLNGDSCISESDLLMLEKYLEFGPDSVTIASCAIQNPPRCCCLGKRGNVSADPGEIVDLSDLSYLVAYLTSTATLSCPKEADWNGSSVIDLTDLSSLVAYLTGGGGTSADCP